ncbi:MAG: response regulator transcription factor [Thermoanaerobaculia bacterium]|nr:MAG: response regulator transcription factor [Thermoanaerobaculia bacterium]MBZ0102172.1 response regulator transcription factor [Thermoanaerobaculia bacterium]
MTKQAGSPGLVAIVDDEANIRETVSFALRKEGYPVECHADGAAAWSAFERTLPALAILDILMPRLDGLELCRRLRGRSETLPILFLSSRDEELDRVLGLELGADDYLCKPFSMRELVARVRVLLRRAALLERPREAGEESIAAGPLELDPRRYQVRLAGRPVPLTVTEFLMLLALVRHPGHVKSRRQLMEQGYAHDTFVSDRTIDSHIKRLRRKLETVEPAFDGIETVYGVGYRYRER